MENEQNNKDINLDFLSGVKTSNDLMIFLEKNPESMRQLQEAILLTKRKTKLLAAKKDEESQVSIENQITIDPKNLNKAIKLISGPFNTENLGTLQLLMDSKSIFANSKNASGDSLLKISLEYLKTKERVELEWPFVLLNAGAKVGAPELEAIISLCFQRGDLYSSNTLGVNGVKFLKKMFSQKNNWGELEKAIVHALKPCDDSLLVFYKNKFAKPYPPTCWGFEYWQGLNNLISNGVAYPLKYQKSAKEQTFWQFLSTVSCDVVQKKQADGSLIEDLAESQRVNLERIKAFELMKERDWFVHSCAVMAEDGLNSNYDATTAIAGSNYVKVSPSRGFIRETPLISSSVEILELLCKYEKEKGIESAFDSIGRSRLFFVNERSRSAKSSGQEVHEVLKKLAHICVNWGDKIEWINPQNPFAKASIVLLPWVEAQYDAQQITGALGEAGTRGEGDVKTTEVKKLRTL